MPVWMDSADPPVVGQLTRHQVAFELYHSLQVPNFLICWVLTSRFIKAQCLASHFAECYSLGVENCTCFSALT